MRAMRAMPLVSAPANHGNSPVTTSTTTDATVRLDDHDNMTRNQIQTLQLEKMRNGGFLYRKWTLLDIKTLCWITGIHALGGCAPFVFDWGAAMVAMVLSLLTGLGMTLGYHRLLTHRSFKIRKWLEYFFVYFGALAGQKDPMFWVSMHKYHHKYADTERDPHSPNEGFWFSHLGWFCYNDYIAVKCGESRSGECLNVPELKLQWFYRFLYDTYIWHPIALGVLLYVYGGFPYLAWGMGVRTTIVFHITFIVRSVGHVWGKRSWNTPDTSTNHWISGIIALGDGWHNNHHAFPSSARQGLEWWQMDLRWEVIKFLELVGLATDVKLPTEADKRRMALPATKENNKLSRGS